MKKRDRINTKGWALIFHNFLKTPPYTYNVKYAQAPLNYPLVFHNVVSKSIDDSATNLIFFQALANVLSAQNHFSCRLLLFRSVRDY